MEIILIIALTIAILMDVLRIIQYVSLKKFMRDEMREAKIAMLTCRLRELEEEWNQDYEYKGDVYEYIAEHLHDEAYSKLKKDE